LRHEGVWRSGGTTPWHQMVMMGDWSVSHTLVTLSPGKEQPLPTEHKDRWIPEPVWMLCKRSLWPLSDMRS